MQQSSIVHFSLDKHINYQDGSVVSKEVFKNQSCTVTLFAFSKGQGLSEHKTPYDAIVYIVDGEAEITILKITSVVKTGEVIFMPANSPHALQAKKQFKMLLTMAR